MLILKGPEYLVQSLAFAPDAGTLYAVHGFVGVHAWDLADRSGSELKVRWANPHLMVPVFGEFALHPGGRWAFGRCPYAGDQSCFFDLTERAAWPFNFLGVVGQHVAVSLDGRRVVTIGHSDYDEPPRGKTRSRRLYGWTMTKNGPRYAWHRDTPPLAQAERVVFLDNDLLVTQDLAAFGPRVPDHTETRPRLTLRNAASGKPGKAVELPTTQVEQLLASRDGKRVVVRRGTALWAFDATDWKKPPTAVEGKYRHALDERAAAFHPSSNYLLLANNGPSVIVYDTATWKEVRKWKWDVGTLRAVAVSPDGTLAAAAGTRGVVAVWDLDL